MSGLTGDPIVQAYNAFTDMIGTTADYRAWRASVPPPTPPPPPAAPQTANEMKSWTPDQMYVGTAQTFNDWKTQSITYTPEPTPPQDNSYLYLALFLGGLSLLILLRK